jgi:hypothetical protein
VLTRMNRPPRQDLLIIQPAASPIHDLSSAGATLFSSGSIALTRMVLRHRSTDGMRARVDAVNG